MSMYYELQAGEAIRWGHNLHPFYDWPYQFWHKTDRTARVAGFICNPTTLYCVWYFAAPKPTLTVTKTANKSTTSPSASASYTDVYNASEYELNGTVYQVVRVPGGASTLVGVEVNSNIPYIEWYAGEGSGEGELNAGEAMKYLFGERAEDSYTPPEAITRWFDDPPVGGDVKKLYPEPDVEDIAIAIRNRNGLQTTYAIGEMWDAVENLPNEYAASDEGKVVSNGALVAQTARAADITINGTYDTTLNDEVIVNVPNSYAAGDEGKVVSNGALVAQTSATKTQNGTYDTTLNNEIVINVSGGGGGGTIEPLSVTQNGIYTPPSGVDGYAPVTVNVSGGGEPSLPSEYQEVEYIESTGTQYTTPMLLTIPNKSLVSIRFARMTGTNEQAAFGAHSNSGLTSGTAEIGIASGASSAGVSAWGGNSIWIAYESGTTGSPCSAVTRVTTNLADDYITLCKYKTGMLNGRLYMCSIWKPKDAISSTPYELMFKAIPCYRKADGVIGFYEAVSGTFLTNAGSGDFGKGADVN